MSDQQASSERDTLDRILTVVGVLLAVVLVLLIVDVAVSGGLADVVARLRVLPYIRETLGFGLLAGSYAAWLSWRVQQDQQEDEKHDE